MDTNQQQKIITETTEEFLGKMGFSASVQVESTLSSDSQENHLVNIQSEESKFLIGKYGANLAALQHLLRVMVSRKSEEKINFQVDINQYKKEQEEKISQIARDLAAQATQEGKAVIMDPMSAYERRLVHLELENFKGARTESIGEGEDRKVVIKPESISEELKL